MAEQVYSRKGKAETARRSPLHLTLRIKWAFAFAAAVLYLVVVGLVTSWQRQDFLTTMAELDSIHPVEEQLTKVNSAVAFSILELQDLTHSRNTDDGYDKFIIGLEAILAGLDQLRAAYPGLQPSIVSLQRHVALRHTHASPHVLLEVRAGLHELVARLDETTRSVRHRRAQLSRGYRLTYDTISMTTVIGGLVGILVFGGMITLFLTRLTWDLTKLESRALDIVSGYRGKPLEITRGDEVGRLMQSVNGMQSALRLHEQQLEVSRQQHFHHEKMVAIGTLAAAVGHEINNPIAAIHGIAQAMQSAQSAGACDGAPACHPQLILDQTRRISQITRQLSEIAAPQSETPQLLDLNALVRKVCTFVKYDKRLRNVDLALDLDTQLPALRSVADHLTQVLMNLLLNAADATEGVAGRKPRVAVTTKSDAGSVLLEIEDNGCGMDAWTRSQAFDELFTTKPVGKGTGLGLFICKSLVERCGGEIGITSEVDRGTRVRVRLPLDGATKA